MNIKEDIHQKAALITGSFVFLITAFNSHGYYHGDEHYQIIEFTGYLNESVNGESLAWEFREQLRSSLQVWIAHFWFEFSQFLGLSNPYHKLSGLRIISALLSLFAIYKLSKALSTNFKSKVLKVVFQYLSYLLWFVPYLSVRYSSECWAGIFIAIAAVELINHSNSQNQKAIKVGLLLGFSFLLRFQILIAIVPMVVHLLVSKQYKIKWYVNLMAAFALVLFSGFLLDSAFYKEISWSPWNYLTTFIERAAAEESNPFGTSSSKFYFSKLLSYPSYLVGIPFAISLLIQLLNRKISILLTMLLSFLIIHSLIPHKEERFIFPLLLFFPFLLLYGFDLLYSFSKTKKIQKPITLLLGLSFLFTSLIGIPALASKSAGMGRMTISRYIHENAVDKKINLIYMPWSSPYDPWNGLPAHYYQEKDIRNVYLERLCLLDEYLVQDSSKNYLVMRQYDLEHEDCKEKISELGFKLKLKSIPDWINSINSVYKGYHSPSTVLLFEREID